MIDNKNVTLGTVVNNGNGTYTLNYVSTGTDVNGATITAVVRQRTVSLAQLRIELQQHERLAQPHQCACTRINAEITACEAAVAH